MSYLVYGKRTERWYNEDDHSWNEPDKQFMPLNMKGIRTRKQDLKDCFATKEDAQEWIDSHSFRAGVKLEIRRG